MQARWQRLLVLSAFAGAAAEMGEALLVNPYDEERTAESVYRALQMPQDEKRERMTALHERVLRNNVFAWGERFLQALGTPSRTPRVALDPETLVPAFRKANKRLLLLDYDGTLVGFRERPQDAAPDAGLRELLRRLAAEAVVVVLSGRKAAELERWLGDIPNLGLATEHGVSYRGSPDVSTEWKDAVRPILEHFVDRTPGSFIEEKAYALVWHHRTVESEFGEWLATELVSMLEGMLAETELRAYRGNKIVEVKPMWANKGAFATRIVAELEPPDFVLAIGDDRTDEDLFAALPESAWTIRVGDGVSRARYSLPTPRAVRELLGRLLST